MITAGHAVVGTAVEVSTHRRISPVGSPQRHYRLDPPVTDSGGNPQRDVVVIEGFKGSYAFVGNLDGEITDFTALATVATGGDGSTVLCAIGYSLVEAT
jgi:hypothetical protein